MEILRIGNLNFRYPNDEKYALKDISITVKHSSFTVICGESGCGKTTMLKMLKKEITPFGQKSGEILIDGIDIDSISDYDSACRIGFVFQNPDDQIVTDRVWHELAFGAENLGINSEEIRLRVAETASYFGISGWINSDTDELSGGQKQLLNLASVMVMRPEILLLDEPTSRLDPIAAYDFMSILKRMNRELGTTVIMSEHNLEEAFSVADKIIVMENGKVLADETPKNAGPALKSKPGIHNIMMAFPAAVRLYNSLNVEDDCPLSVSDGKAFLKRHFNNKISAVFPESHRGISSDEAVKFKDVWFRYEKQLPDVLKSTELCVKKGEIFCLTGGNGSGKTTLLNIAAGLLHPYRGRIEINGKDIKKCKGNELYRNNLAMLPQSPEIVFTKSTVRLDLEEMPESENSDVLERLVAELNIGQLLERHPYDLSCGEQQKCAIAKILLTKPSVLLLDEPTKGLDAYSKKVLSDILIKLSSQGITILIATHDIEFACNTADRCALFFDGQIVSADTTESFFSNNSFYTTAASRMSRSLYKNTVTNDSVVYMCKLNNEN